MLLMLPWAIYFLVNVGVMLSHWERIRARPWPAAIVFVMVAGATVMGAWSSWRWRRLQRDLDERMRRHRVPRP